MRPRAARLVAAAAGLGLAAAAGPGAAAAPAAGGGSRQTPEILTVVDAAGGVVGEVVHIEPTGSMQDGSVQVTLDAGGRVLLVGVAADRFTFGTASVGFASPDCSGPALLYTGQPIGETVLGLAGVGPGNQLLVASGAAPASVAIHSSWNTLFSGPPACSPFPDATMEAVPGVAVLDLDTHQPPFAIGRPRPGARPPPTPAAMTDGAGALLGRVVGASAFLAKLTAAVPTPDGVALVAVRGQALLNLDPSPVIVFTSGGCSGPPLIVDELGPSFPRLYPLTGLGPGNVLHVATGSPVSTALGSSWDPEQPPPHCQPLGGQVHPAAPTRPLVDLGHVEAPFGVPSLAAIAAAGRAGRRGVAAHTVVDADGRTLGFAFAGVSTAAQVVFRAGPVAAWALVGANRVLRGSHQALYEAADCSGPVLIEPFTIPGAPRAIFPRSALARTGELVVEQDEPPSDRVIASEWDAASLVPTCHTPAPASRAVVPTSLLLDVGTFTPPLRPE